MPSEKSSSGTVWLTVVAFVIPVLAILGSLNSYQVSSANAQQFPDTYGAARYQIRFAPLLGHIFADAEIGYFTDVAPSDQRYSAAYLNTQYALAPRAVILVTPGMASPPEFAVGNFSRQMDYAAEGDQRGYSVMADFGQGVVLFKRKGL